MSDHHDRPDEHAAEELEEPVVHGGEGDPLGGGVAELEDTGGVGEGEPRQDVEQLDR